MTTHNLPATQNADIQLAGQPPKTLMQKGVEKLRQHAELKLMATDYADFITKSGLCPEIYEGKPLQAAAAIIRGTALGFDPDGALEAFFVIKGKTGMYARAMIAVAENVGCRVWEVKANDTSVTWAGTRPGDNKAEQVTWTIERAQRAGYTSNVKYKTNPQEMLRAKCQAELARILAPGALMGLISEVEKDEVLHTTYTNAARANNRGMDQVRAALSAKKQLAQDVDTTNDGDVDGEDLVNQFLQDIEDADSADTLDLIAANVQQQLPESEWGTIRQAWDEKLQALK